VHCPENAVSLNYGVTEQCCWKAEVTTICYINCPREETTSRQKAAIFPTIQKISLPPDHLVIECSEFLATKPEVPGSIPGGTTFSEK
jgi:hypothetical protein